MLKLSHSIAVQWRLAQHCKSAILQLKKIFFKLRGPGKLAPGRGRGESPEEILREHLEFPNSRVFAHRHSW